MNILITGAAGFIGSAFCQRILSEGKLYENNPESIQVIGLDNINDYYDTKLKFERLSLLGIPKNDVNWNKFTQSTKFPNFKFIRMNLENDDEIMKLFEENNFVYVVHLAAQAGVRYSIEHPRTYIKSNIDGFINILEGCRHFKVKHLVYASSSSVYGLNGKVPFSEHDSIAHPVSLYAATKKSNELMAHAYSKLYDLPTTGLRFFTVYGPMGRPDMSPWLFIEAILNDRPIKVFNHGDMLRDFTYIDDIVEGIYRLIPIIPESNKNWDEKKPDPASSTAPYKIYNIGNSKPIKLMDYIQEIEKAVNKKAIKEFLPMQLGDVYQTNSDSTELAQATGFTPNTTLKEGIIKTIGWFINYNYRK